MKIVMLAALISLSSCSHYSASSISKNRVMVSKNTNVLGLIQFGEVFTCKTDNSGRIDTCFKNHIEDEDEKQARIKREADEKARRDAINSRAY